MAVRWLARYPVRGAPRLAAVGARTYGTVVPLDEELPGLVTRPGTGQSGPLKPSTTSNGLTVAAQETHSPVCKLALLIGAGARDEGNAQLGVSAVARRLAYKSTVLHSQLAIGREIERLGGDLVATSSRESTLLTVRASRDHLPRLVGLLAEELAGRHVALAWEVDQAKKELLYELETIGSDPLYQVVEALHQAAFRGPLSQALLPAAHRLEAVDAASLTDFVGPKYVASNASLAAVGVDPDQFFGLTEEAFAGADRGSRLSRQPAEYKGGQDIRLDAGTRRSYVALGFEGSRHWSASCLATNVLLYALGTGSGLNRGRLARAADTIKAPVQLSAFHSSYSDTGLLGVVGVASADDVGCLMGAAKEVLGSVVASGLTDAEVARAKSQLQTHLLHSVEGEDQLEHLASQAYFRGSCLSSAELVRQIESVTTADVSEVAKRILGSRPCLASLGNVASTPFLDQLLL